MKSIKEVLEMPTAEMAKEIKMLSLEQARMIILLKISQSLEKLAAKK